MNNAAPDMANIKIVGNLFSHQSSMATQGHVTVDAHGHLDFIADNDGASQRLGTLEHIAITDRLGNTPRRFSLPSGQSFETLDNDQVDALLAMFGRGKVMRKVAWLEGHGKIAFAALILILAMAFSAFRWGVPVVAEAVAFAMPESMVRAIGEDTLPQLDRLVFEPSKLDLGEQNRIKRIFKRLVENHPQAQGYTLHIRDGGAIGANAFALPGGQLIVTDHLINLATTPDEIAGVMAHEIAHVDHRHGMRTLLQATALPLMMIWIAGDMDGAADLLLNSPTLLLSASYSRDFEREADQTGTILAARAGYDPRALATILTKMTDACGEQCKGNSFYSSHPPTEEREKAIDEAAETYRPELSL